MLKIHGEIHGLATREGAYVNVLRGLTDGGIGVWGNCYEKPTYLLLRGLSWLLVVFDDDPWRDQELPKLIKLWAADTVLELPDMKPCEAEK